MRCASQLAALSMFAAGSPVLSAPASSWASPRHVLFYGGPDAVVDFEVHELKARPVVLPPGLTPKQATLAPDGRMVFTSFDKAVGNVLLFVWDSAHPDIPPKSISEDRGYHTDPSVSLDGQWVYFAHNPHAHGPPGDHGDSNYAQIYRVHLDGTALEALTSGPGCHFGPAPLPGAKAAVYVHATCHVGRKLELWRTGQLPQGLTGLGEDVGETSIAPDGRTALFAVSLGGKTAVREIDLATMRTRSLFDLPPSFRVQPSYGSTRNQVLFLRQGIPSLWSSGSIQPLTHPQEEASR